MKLKNFALYMMLPVLAVMLALTACSDDDGGTPPADDTGRTVLAYIVATNSLNGADDSDIEQMREAVKAGALGKNDRLLIYRTAYDVDPELARMNADGTTEVVHRYDAGVNSLDPDFMASVIDEAMTLAPNDDFGLILWSHSTGWRGIEQTAPTASRSFGDDNGRLMPIPELARVFDRLPKLTYIYFDSCFMGNAESLYELRDAADWVVASPAETPYDGSPYDLTLASLFDAVPDGLAECARITNTFYKSQSSTIGVYRMSGMEALAGAVADALASTQPLLDIDAVQQYGFARRYVYFPNTFFDLEDYLNARGCSPMTGVKAAIDNVVYSFYATPTMWGLYPLERVCGLSLFPYDELTADGNRYSYTDLAWYTRVYN